MSPTNVGEGGNVGTQTPQMNVITGDTNISDDFFEPVSDEGQSVENTPEPTNQMVPPEQGQGTENDGQTPPEQGQEEASQQPAEETWDKHFKTPEEMFEAYQKTNKSYKNLVPEFTKKAQELSSLKKGTPQTQDNLQQNIGSQLQQGQPQPQYQQQMTPQQIQQQQQAEAVDRYINARINAALQQAQQPQAAVLEQMQTEMEIQRRSNDLARIHAKEPEMFEAVYPSMTKVAEANPELTNLPNAMQIVYNLAKVQYLEDNADTIATANHQRATQQVLAKQSVPGAGGQVTDQGGGKSYEEGLAEGIVNTAKKYNGSLFG